MTRVDLYRHLKAVCRENRIRLIALASWPAVRLDHSLRTLAIPDRPGRADYFLALIAVGSVRARERFGRARPPVLEKIEGLEWALHVSLVGVEDSVVDTVVGEFLHDLPMLFPFFMGGATRGALT